MSRRSEIEITITVEGANPQALAATIIQDLEERYPWVRAALLEAVTVYAEEVTPCDFCQDSEVLYLDQNAGEVECQDCGSIWFTNEEVPS